MSVKGHRVGVRRETRRYINVCRHRFVNTRIFGACVTPADKVITRVCYGRHCRTASTVIHRLRRRAGDGAVRACHIRQRIGVDGEVCRNCNSTRHVRICPGISRAPVTPIDKMIPHVGYGCYRRAAAAVIHRLRRRPRDGTVRPRNIRQRVLVNRVVRPQGHGFGDVHHGQGIRGSIEGAALCPVHKMVTDRCVCGNRRAIISFHDGLGSGAGKGRPRCAVCFKSNGIGRRRAVKTQHGDIIYIPAAVVPAGIRPAHAPANLNRGLIVRPGRDVVFHTFPNAAVHGYRAIFPNTVPGCTVVADLQIGMVVSIGFHAKPPIEPQLNIRIIRAINNRRCRPVG